MNRFDSYKVAEEYIKQVILLEPDFKTKTTYEKFNLSFILTDILNNKNDRSDYTYAEEFFKWILSGQHKISDELLSLNPWVKRFVDTSGLPNNFSSSYGTKIMSELNGIIRELEDYEDSRRAYVNILYHTDSIIRISKTSHEYPCTIGLHFLVRNEKLHLIVNMRSNNCHSVMPYDVYNFTSLQKYVAQKLHVDYGEYHHQMNSAHIYKGDVRRLFNQIP